jgi:hypothetical protein
MPPDLTAALAALAVQAGPGEFTAVESLLGGAFPLIAEIRRDPVAEINAASLIFRRSGTGCQGFRPERTPSFALPGSQSGPAPG